MEEVKRTLMEHAARAFVASLDTNECLDDNRVITILRKAADDRGYTFTGEVFIRRV